MTKKKKNIGFLLDENVPDAVGKVLEAAGHTVHYLNREDIVIRGSEDSVVARAAAINDLVLVSQDGDMKQIAKEFGVSNSRYRNLSLIKISCVAPDAAQRFTELMSLIEHEWAVTSDSDERRLPIEIKDTLVRIQR